MNETAPDMKVRLPFDLRRKIEAAARKNGRSLNSEITFRLERSFSDPGADRLTKIEERLRDLEAWKESQAL